MNSTPFNVIAAKSASRYRIRAPSTPYKKEAISPDLAPANSPENLGNPRPYSSAGIQASPVRFMVMIFSAVSLLTR